MNSRESCSPDDTARSLLLAYALSILPTCLSLSSEIPQLINDLLAHFVDDATSNAADVAKLRASTFEAGNLGTAPLLQPSSAPPPVLMASDLMPYIREVWPSLAAVANDSTLHPGSSASGATTVAVATTTPSSHAASSSGVASQTSRASGGGKS